MKYSRSGKCAILGYYDHSDNTIAINKYAIEMWSIKSIVDVIKHELIHARCYQDYDHGGHGEHFQMLCNILGLDKETTRAKKTKAYE
jgi:predicted SprT family Zn-dependent metalloprotease